MILTKVTLKPFAGLTDRTVELKTGLNVIVGPNEAGKSTIFNAIQAVLFTPIRLTKRDFQKNVLRFLPVGGGDTIHVQLEFKKNDQNYILSKTWGATRQAVLTLPDGSVITEESEIHNTLLRLLPATEGTFKSVLMTYQTGLNKTIDDLRRDPGALQSLGDLLRKSFLETEGISVEKFKQKVEEHFDAYFLRWDRDKNYPEKNRGIENPYRGKIGLILQAFYEKEDLKRKLRDARLFDDRMDELNQQINQCTERITNLEDYVQKNKKAVEDARERRVVEAQLETINSRVAKLKEVNQNWPVLESRISEIRGKLPAFQEKLDALEKELGEAKRYSQHKELQERFERVCGLKKKLEQAEKELRLTTKLTRDELELIQQAVNKVESLKTSLKSGQLWLRFLAEKDYDLTYQKDLDAESRRTVHKGEPFELEAGGRITLTHADWMMEVRSGEGNFEQISEALREAENQRKELFERHAIADLQTAKKINQEYEEKEQTFRTIKQQYQQELGEDRFEDLESAVENLKVKKPSRSLEEILQEKVNIERELSEMKDDLKKNERIVEEYEIEYETPDGLLSRLSEELNNQKNLQQKLDRLAPLPEDVTNVEAFIRYYSTKEEELEKLKKTKTGLLLERAQLENQAPEISAEELEKQLGEAEAKFEQVCRKGEAVARIQELTAEILDKIDMNTYRGLTETLQEYVALLTAGRYKKVQMDESLPQGFVREDGGTLTYDLLSTGTQDVLALALRITMALHFLGEADGFVIMDDPLVDLDPERQRRAAQVINQFAREKQTIIFTCHPSHAELLSGHRITL